MTHEGESDDLADLREAVMKASDPKPGWHLEALLVVSAWARDDNENDVIADFIGTPPDGMMELVRQIRLMPWPGPS